VDVSEIAAALARLRVGEVTKLDNRHFGEARAFQDKHPTVMVERTFVDKHGKRYKARVVGDGYVCNTFSATHFHVQRIGSEHT
jgi:hypothetical protein